LGARAIVLNFSSFDFRCKIAAISEKFPEEEVYCLDYPFSLSRHNIMAIPSAASLQPTWAGEETCTTIDGASYGISSDYIAYPLFLSLSYSGLVGL
jgi:hypothetical protein